MRDLFKEAGISLDDDSEEKKKKRNQERDLFAEAGITVEPKDGGFFESIKDLGRAVAGGAQSTLRSIGATGNTVTGDLADVERYASNQSKSENEKPAALKRLNEDLATRQKALGDDPGVVDSVKSVGSAALANPEGTAQFVAEQLPNSAVSLASGAAGAKGGAALGAAVGSVIPVVGTAAGAAVGGVAGFLGGMFLGNAALEIGGKAIEKASDGFTQAERGEALKEGSVKGGVVTLVDAATLGLGGAVSKSLGKAVIQAGAKAEAKVLADAGVNIADNAAIEVALSADKVLRQTAKEAGQEAAKAVSTFGKKLTSAGTVGAMETVGEGLGEYLGELAATGKADVYNAVIESLAGLSQSAAETVYNVAKAQGNDLNSSGIAEQSKGLLPAQSPTATDAGQQVQAEQAPAGQDAQAVPDANLLPGQDAEQALQSTQPEGLQNADAAQELAPVNQEEQPQVELQTTEQPGPVQQQFSQQELASVETRLAELELIGTQRELTEQEQGEAQGLLSVLDQADQAEQFAQQSETQSMEQALAAQSQQSQEAMAVDGQTELEQATQLAEQSQQGPMPGQGQQEAMAVSQEQAPQAIGEAQQSLPKGQDVNLQNRDRSRVASVMQMAEIAKNPDFLRLGFSNSPENGAPMVFAVGDDTVNLPADTIGREDVAVMSDGQRVPFRYAVVEADVVQPSNFASGDVNPEFASNVNGTVKALNNGRTAGVRAAYEQGTAGQYRAELTARAQDAGIDPGLVERMKAPMLVRLYSESSNTANMAAKSQGQSMGLSPGEQASQDASLIDGRALASYQSAGLASQANIGFVREFIGRLAQSGQDVAGMITSAGTLSPQGVRRIEAALTQAAYSDAELVNELFDSLDTEIRAIGEALKTVAGEWAAMREAVAQGMVAPDVDITDNLMQAVGLIRKARRDSLSLYELSRQVDLLVGDAPDQITLGLLSVFYTGKHYTRAVGKDKLVSQLRDYINQAMSTTAGPDLFGDVIGAADILTAMQQKGGFNAIQEAAAQSQLEPSSSSNAGSGAGQSGGGGQRQLEAGAREGVAGNSQEVTSAGKVTNRQGNQKGDNSTGQVQEEAGLNAKRDAEEAPKNLENSNGFVDVKNLPGLSTGPGGKIKPRPIASGKALFRETNLDGLDDLLRLDRQADLTQLFVSDNPDLAIGQASNTGVFIEFRPDALSGEVNLKPGANSLTGQEYKTDLIAPKAVAAFTLRAVDLPKLRALSRKIINSDFEKNVLGNGFVQYTRKGLQVTGATGSIATKNSKTKAKTKETTQATQDKGQVVVSKNTIITDDAAEKARAILKKKLTQLNSGIDPELFQAGVQLALYHVERGARTFSAYAKAMLDDIGDAALPYLKQWYEGVRYDPRSSDIAESMSSPMDVYNTDIKQLKEDVNVQPTTPSAGSNSQSADEAQVNENPVSDEQSRARGNPGTASKAPGSQPNRPNGNRGLPDGGPVADGKRGDSKVLENAGGFQDDATRANQPGTSTANGTIGVEPQPNAGGPAKQLAGKVSGLEEKIQLQRNAEAVPVKFGDTKNIDETLPMLSDGQREDVLFTEKRWQKPNGYGVLFTNGTGTGKTLLGLGVIKRLVKSGKGNVIVVVPNEAVINAWINDAKKLDMQIVPLESTSTAGKGVVVTTYANFGQNDTLAKRNWDAIVMDEAHSLMQGGQAGQTNALAALRAIAMHPDGSRKRAEMLNPGMSKRVAENKEKAAVLRERLKQPSTTDAQRAEYQREIVAIESQILKDIEALDKAYKKSIEEVNESQGEKRPRALFLSATPFAYEKNVQWANGFLFEFGESTSTGYNQASGFEKFMVTHFGYRMRYNKLTEPDAKVDRDLMQRNFNSWLRKEGVLSTRVLDVDADYERKFVLIEQGIGQKIDDGMDWLRNAENGRYRRVADVVSERFDRLARVRLLEAIKANAAVPYIKKHHEIGRKVVVFYDFNTGGGSNPFDVSDLLEKAKINEKNKDIAEDQKFVDVPVRGQGKTEYQKVKTERVPFSKVLEEFMRERADLQSLNFSSLKSPLKTLLAAFPGAGVYNGMPEFKKTRVQAIRDFNDDSMPEKNLLLVQKSANAGWSGHDTTGKNQRVLINLGLPTAPIESIQQEGRIYRTGQVTDAIFQYFNTGTSWERYAFGATISRRAGTAENLAMGEQARGLREAFIQAFENSEGGYSPSKNEGKGGKQFDRGLINAITEFDKAKALYFAQQKRTSQNKSAEGTDYFATPEPIGLKMVEFADIRFGESVLEPSAGHGAIARWFPEASERSMIEPSAELASRLSLASDGRIIDDVFENHNIVNKYDAIVMNPPFGSGGKTAIEHLAKAANHLRDGGRVVALLPDGPAANKRFENWLMGQDDKGKPNNPELVLVSTISLPTGVFERAGTNVKTRIIVIDKIAKAENRLLVQQSNFDLEGMGKVEQVFDAMEGLSVSPRLKSDDSAVPTNSPVRGATRQADIEAREAEKVAQETGVIAQSKEDVFFTVDGKKLITNAPLVKVTTSKGKELEGVLVPDFKMAKQIDEYTYAPMGKAQGYLVRLRHIERPSASGNNKNYASSPNGWGDIEAEPMTMLSDEQQKRVVEIVQNTAGITPSFMKTIRVKAGTKGMEAWGNTSRDANAAGFYENMNDIIVLALDTPAVSANKYAYHESFHRLQNLFLTEQEKKLLEAEDAKLRKMIVEKGQYSPSTVAAMSIKEVQAEAFGIWADGKDTLGMVAPFIVRAWRQIKAMLARVKNYLNGNGFKTSEDVFAMAKSGAISKRDAGNKANEGVSFGASASVIPDRIEVDGKQRPTTNSKGQPLAQTEEGVRNFWRWFGDSKVVDAEGKPLVVYHGTTADIEAFDPERAGQEKYSDWGKGTYFTPSADTANYYRGEAAARIDTESDRLWELLQEEEKKTTWKDGVPTYTDEHARLLDEWRKARATAEDRAGSVMPAYLSLKNPLTEGYSRMPNPDLANQAKGKGHDGIIVLNGSGGIDEIVAFRPEQIKSALGNRGTFDPLNPDINFAILNLNGNVPPTPGPGQQSNFDKAKERLANLVSPETITGLIYRFQDRFVDLLNLREHIKKIGGAISDLNDAYLGEELYHSRLAKRVKDFLSDELRPLLSEMRKLEVSRSDFEKFLHARHAPEANKVLAERNPSQATIDKGTKEAEQELKKLGIALGSAKAKGMATASIEQSIKLAQQNLRDWKTAQAFQGTEEERNSLSGMTDQEAKDYMASLTPEQTDKLNKLAAMVDAMNEKTLQTMEAYGLMSKRDLDAWRKTYKHYVPLFRDDAHAESRQHPIGQGFNVRGPGVKQRVGSNAEVTNILGHIAMQREAALTRGEKNNVVKRLYLMAMQNPDEKVWKIDKAPTISTIDKKTGFVNSYPDPNFKNLPNVISLRVAGKDRFIVVNENNQEAMRMASALKNLDINNLNIVSNLVGKATRWFASVNTQYNPIFGAFNFARDVQGAILNLSTTAIAGKQKEVAAAVLPAMRAIYRDTRGKGAANKKNAEWVALWNDLQLSGGTTGYRDLYSDIKDRTNALQKELSSLDRGMAAKAGHAVAKWLSDYNETAENAVRVAVYKVALDKGLSKDRAASIAKNITVNFNRKGSVSRDIGAWYAFFNAAIQGTARMYETLTGPAGKKIMAGGVAVGLFSSLIAMAAMGGLGGDDDDEDDNYSKIPPFVKERSLIIPLGKDEYFAFPMPLGFNVLPNIGRIAAEWAFGRAERSNAQRIGDLIGILANSFNPFGGSAPAAQMVAPTVIDPIVALLQNIDWTGKQIYQEGFSNLDPAPGYTMAKDSASTPSKAIAEAINTITGGNEYRPGAWSPTPDQLDFVFGQLTGGVGRELIKLNATLAAPFNGDELPASKIPVIGRLYGNTSGPSGESGKFYENIRELNIVENELQGRAKKGEDIDEFLSKPTTQLVAQGNAAERQVRELRKMRREIVSQGLPDSKEQSKQINAQISGIMKDLNREYSRAKELSR